MAKGKQVTPPKRDYKAERERTKQNKASAQQEAPSEKKAGPAKAKKPKVNEELKKTAATHDISLHQISSDPNQPRKFFDAGELLELSKSILQHGVIEPILLRPDADGFIIVFGERRFRACMLAAEVNTNLQTIPAMIKGMTADEAFALQIAENLHRKDPHPIEEAYAFKKMLERGQTAEDIAATVCKSTKFVAMRLMLNDLITEWQDVFFANKIKIGEAVKLAKLGMDSQKEIYNEEVPDNWKEDEDFQLNDFEYYIGQNERNLDAATFDITDPALYPESGSCVGCKFNSLSNLVLFQTDKTTKGICSNVACYGVKRSRAYNNTIEEVMTDPEVIFIAGSSYLSDTDKLKIAELKKTAGVTIANGNGIKFNDEQLIAPSWNEFIENNPMDENDEDQESYEARIAVEFAEEEALYKNFMQDYEAAKAEGRVKKAFIVCGHNEGKFTNILLSEDKQGTLSMPDGSPMTSDIAQQVKTIETRLARAGELDSEKIWLESKELIDVDDFSKYTNPTVPREQNRAEEIGLTVAMFQTLGTREQNEFAEEVLGTDNDDINVYFLLESISEEHYNILCRLFMKRHLFPIAGSAVKSLANYAGLQIIKSLFPEGIATIEQAHKDKAEKRARNAKKKIDDLLNPKQGKQDKEEEQGDEE